MTYVSDQTSVISL